MTDQGNHFEGLDRRTVLRRGAAVAGGVWAVPVIESLTRPAAAASPAPPPDPTCTTNAPYFPSAQGASGVPLVCSPSTVALPGGGFDVVPGACTSTESDNECSKATATREGENIEVCFTSSTCSLDQVYITTASFSCYGAEGITAVVNGCFSFSAFATPPGEDVPEEVQSFQILMTCDCPTP